MNQNVSSHFWIEAITTANYLYNTLATSDCWWLSMETVDWPYKLTQVFSEHFDLTSALPGKLVKR